MAALTNLVPSSQDFFLLISCIGSLETAGVLPYRGVAVFHCCPGSVELSGISWTCQGAGSTEHMVKFREKNL